MIRIPGFSAARREEILLSVRPGYVALTLLLALLLNILPLSGAWLALRPDFVALALLYWGIEHPRRVGFLPAFLLGLAMDVADGSLFGQHALAYSVLMFAAIAVHRRVAMFGMRDQMLHVLGILLVCQLVVLGVRHAAGGAFPGWWYFLSSATGAAAWPFARHLIAAPLHPRTGPQDI
ncbi:MAG TPA: rod shape-determining protein MreD [Burkholderiales bacterium]|nr:rod shape-determining protein MreD [Burkholderiales bacterium]